MKVPFFQLVPQYRLIEKEVKKAIDEVMETQQFILGPQVESLEKTIANYCNTRCAVGVASGSDALFLALLALDIGPGDEVILPPFTFFATAGSVSRAGATPVFADIDPDTYNIDPSRIEEKITPKTKAILPVHLYGQCADMDPILRLAKSKHLFVIEDAAQALGSEYKPTPGSPARKAGGIGEVGCFSFFPTKNLGAFGDAGMMVSDDPLLAERMKMLRVHGGERKYLHKLIGINSRLDAIQAAILLTKFRHLERWHQARQKRAERYRELFQDLLRSVPGLRLPVIQYENRHIFHQYVIRAPQRDRLRQYLLQEEVGTEVYYPLPLHLQECYSFLNHRTNDFPISEKAAQEVLALPIFPELTEDQQVYVVDRIHAFYKKHGVLE